MRILRAVHRASKTHERRESAARREHEDSRHAVIDFGRVCNRPAVEHAIGPLASVAARVRRRRRRAVVSFALLPRWLRAGRAGVARAGSTGKPQGHADARRLDSRRRGRNHHRLHRQGRARAGHQDGARSSSPRKSSSSSPARIRLVTADTARTPNEGYTAGSHSMKDSGTAIMNAAAQVREMLVGMAASRLGVPSRQPGGRGRQSSRGATGAA